MPDIQCDVCVIGAGPGGYVAAIRAAQLGLKTVIVEREHMGGVCSNWGCIPTKALLRTAEVYTNMRHAKDFGLKAENISFDLKAVVDRSRKIADRMASGVAFLMKKNKIGIIDGTARLEKGERAPIVRVRTKAGEETVRASHVILATGARARTLPKAGLEPDGKFVWTAHEAMIPDQMPGRLLVIGSGAIGIEFASFFRALGSDVTVVEMLDRILPAEDEEISKLAEKAFRKQGMKLLTSATVEKLDKGAATAKATVKMKDGQGKEKTETVEADRVILAIGITGNTENLGLEAMGAKIDKGHLVVNEWLETGVPGLYAIGDLVGPPWLAHKASHEGVIVAERIAGLKGHPLDTTKIPGCTYSSPQVASVGLTEAAAKAKGLKIKVGRFPFMGNGKAVALGEPDGLVKTIFDERTGELLGAHLIGAEVTELVHVFSLGRAMEATEEDFFHAIFPHPTLSEMVHESALDAFGRVVHV